MVCNQNLISLLTKENKSPQFINQLFMHLSNFNDGLMESFDTNSLPILVEKIKETFDTPELQKEFINTYKNHEWNIPKQVAKILHAELETVADPSSDTQENPDDKQ